MKDQVSRAGFPKSGPIFNAFKFICETPAPQHDHIYVGPVPGKPGWFNFCLFPMPVQLTDEMKELLRTAKSVTSLSGNSSSDKSTHS